MNEKSIFIDALDKTDPAERSAFLDEACAGDDTLRQRVEALLKSHIEAGSFLGKLAPERVAKELSNPPTELETQNDMNADEKDDLGFLSPSEKPDSLGRLGHYEILEVIGHGGMGIVLRAFDEKLHRVVAIKVMAPALAATSPPRKRFLREARSAAQVRHENVVDIHAVEEQPIPYLVMEYVSGETLQQKLDRVGPLEIPDVLRIGQQIARSLAAAHERGLIHRDIKPSNILLENSVDERVKITDFGLARAVADASLTQSGVIAGTPMYMAPEQTIGDTIDHRADLFSLGSVLYTMVSGRPPFRATTSMATLKRVAEDTPRPIREIIPEVPEWVCDIISKLHAKKPEDRFQTAKEVADLLGKCLTELQQGRVISVAQAASIPEKAEHATEAKSIPVTNELAVSLSSGKRRWPIAAAILILLIGGFCLSEVFGVTNVRSTVIRIFTPDGTLIVEADDPNVKVTIEGDGGLVITGAGVQEVRLPPGSYKVQAIKDGKPVALDRELVSITKGGREVVRVKFEAPPAPANPKVEGAFVLLSGDGTPSVKFDTLAAAVRAANDGDTIEVRGNGPFITDPVTITGARLILRAGSGFRPIIRLSPQGAQTYNPILQSDRSLVVEGLEFQRFGQKDWVAASPLISMVRCSGPALHLANCRFRWDTKTYQEAVDAATATCVIRNCEFLGPMDSQAISASDMRPVRLQRLENSVLLCDRAIGWAHFGNEFQHDVELIHNTLVSVGHPLNLTIVTPPSPQPGAGERPCRAHVSSNLFDASSVLRFSEHSEWLKQHKPLTESEAAQLIPKLLTWREEQSSYSAGANATWFWCRREPPSLKMLAGPDRLCGGSAKSVEGKIRYQGGDLRARLATEPDKITPDDFRLRPDSPGYKAGKGGKDLGADVDLVGPGAAYERWKKTPEYQQWLKDSGQIRSVLPKTEPGAFVVLGGPDVAERKFETLAEAVTSASDRDTIEVRGNGPYILDPVVIKTPLVIQAGAGFQPVFLGSAAADAEGKTLIEALKPLVLEGLQIKRRLNFPKGGNVIVSRNAPLYLANCRLLNTGNYNSVQVASYFSEIQVSNCEILGPSALGISCQLPTNGRLQITNSVCSQVFNLSLQPNPIDRFSVHLERNTFRTSAQPLRITLRKQDKIPQDGCIRLELTSNVVHGKLGTFMFDQTEVTEPFLPDEQAEKVIPRIVKWHESRNLHQARASFTLNRQPLPGARGTSTLDEWNKFWGLATSDALIEEPKYVGGDLTAKLENDGEQVTPQDFRLRPDSPGFKAGKDGKDLGADVDLVGPGAYERWKKTPEYQQWLKDTEHVRAKPGRKSEPGAFVLLGGKGTFEKKYDTLSAAVLGASAGDTIEVRGNGPYILDRINIKTPLVIRAGAGFQPHFIGSAAADAAGDPLIAVSAVLMLEGLQFDRRRGNSGWLITCGNAPLFIANCRLLNAEKSQGSALGIWHSPEVVVRNCEILRPDASAVSLGYSLPPKGRMHISNSVLGLPPNLVFGDFKADLSVILDHNTIQTTKSGATLRFSFFKKDAIPTKKHSIRMEVTGNVLDGAGTLLFNDIEGSLVKDETNQFFSNIVHWQERQNLHQARVSAMHNYNILPGFKASNLKEWNKFWGLATSDALIGRPKFVGGDLQTKLSSGWEQVTAQDYRLRPDSAGYKSGKDGKDLGADVDLVGPGAAYERWRKTPEYQQWLKDSGQFRAESLKTERNAFVVLNGKNVEVAKFDTLAEAVKSSTNGDTIEIRGKGPFVTDPLKINKTALTLRAGAGFAPVIQLSEAGTQAYGTLLETDAPLVLEGLEFQRLGQMKWEAGKDVLCTVRATGSSLRVANCCFRSDGANSYVFQIVTTSATSNIRNSLFLTPSEVSIDVWGKSLVIDNCIHLGRLAIGWGNSECADFKLNRNTLVSPTSQAINLYAPATKPGETEKPRTLEVAETLFDVSRVVHFGPATENALSPTELQARLVASFRWKGRDNVYQVPGHFVFWKSRDGEQPPHGPGNLTEWGKFWKAPEPGSVQGAVRYQGGDLQARLAAEIDKITPDDFRFRPDSAGFKAGKDGKDLGADVDLVGPGAAYERWRKTPAYQQWLKDSGQVK